MTKDISAGPPTKDCVRDIIDDVAAQSTDILFGFSIAFAVIGLLQMSLLGGMPKTNGTEIISTSQLEVIYLNGHDSLDYLHASPEGTNDEKKAGPDPRDDNTSKQWQENFKLRPSGKSQKGLKK